MTTNPTTGAGPDRRPDALGPPVDPAGELVFRNLAAGIWKVTLEPCGTEHLLDPGGKLTLLFEGARPVRPSLVFRRDALVLFAWPGSVIQSRGAVDQAEEDGRPAKAKLPPLRGDCGIDLTTRPGSVGWLEVENGRLEPLGVLAGTGVSGKPVDALPLGYSAGYWIGGSGPYRIGFELGSEGVRVSAEVGTDLVEMRDHELWDRIPDY